MRCRILRIWISSLPWSPMDQITSITFWSQWTREPFSSRWKLVRLDVVSQIWTLIKCMYEYMVPISGLQLNLHSVLFIFVKKKKISVYLRWIRKRKRKFYFSHSMVCADVYMLLQWNKELSKNHNQPRNFGG